MGREYYVYVLKSLSCGKHYIGSTGNLENRIEAHNSGLSSYTKGRMPWILVYKEKYSSRSEAMRRERFLKSGKGREELKNILSQNTEG